MITKTCRFQDAFLGEVEQNPGLGAQIIKGLINLVKLQKEHMIHNSYDIANRLVPQTFKQ